MDDNGDKRKCKMHVNVKIDLMLVLLVIVSLVLAWMYFRHTNALGSGLKESMQYESESVRTHVSECSAKVGDKVDARAEEMEKRLESLDAKLDRIEAKIDRLTRLVSPPLPDGLQRADEPGRR